MKQETYYIGEKTIDTAVETNTTTAGGDKIIAVHLSDGSNNLFPLKVFELIKTNQPSDSSTVQKKIVEYITSQILIVMKEANIKLAEINPILDLVITSINENTEKANNILWGVEFADQRTFLMIDNILKNGSTK